MDIWTLGKDQSFRLHSRRRLLCAVNILLITLGFVQPAQGQTYNHALAIFRDKLNPSVYNTEVPPLINQSETLIVTVSFELMSIVAVDDVSQSFICNGVVRFIWTDQLLRWDPADYGGMLKVGPKSNRIWRPQVLLLNTLEERDIFADDKVTANVFSNGTITWFAGSLFTTSCELDMTNYPYDEQICFIRFIPMGYYTSTDMKFQSFSGFRTTFFSKSGEWQFLGGDVKAILLNTSRNITASGFEISVHIRRNPKIIAISIILPIAFLSFMNLMVFFIPVDSGEKISYGMSVLLSLSVYMSVVSGMLPRSSDTVPELTKYLFSLLILSLLTVIDTIIIVFLHHLEERENKRQKAAENMKRTTKEVIQLQRVVAGLSPSAPTSGHADNTRHRSETTLSNSTSQSDDKQSSDPRRNKYKTVGKYIDKVSFVVFLIIWLILTLIHVIAVPLTSTRD